MRRKLLIGLSLSCILMLGGCERGERAPPGPQPAAVTAPEHRESTAAPRAGGPSTDGHSSRTSLDWAGTYSGVLPCASCPGIETVVTLHADGRYRLSQLYLDEHQTPLEHDGRFVWDTNGSHVTLDTGSSEAQHYQVGENLLIRLDREGRRIEGALAGHYVLHKHSHDPAIEDQRWQLIELRGRPIAAGSANNAGLTLRAADALVSGNASCNSFSAHYVITSGRRIRFDRHMATTMMACADMDLEVEFFEVLRMTDNYTVGDDGTLGLNRARMAPLARFLRVKADR
jgi:copper homeostasis protein (lipoprotein)